MKNNTLKFGLGLGIGAYIYEVISNLLENSLYRMLSLIWIGKGSYS